MEDIVKVEREVERIEIPLPIPARSILLNLLV